MERICLSHCGCKCFHCANAVGSAKTDVFSCRHSVARNRMAHSRGLSLFFSGRRNIRDLLRKLHGVYIMPAISPPVVFAGRVSNVM